MFFVLVKLYKRSLRYKTEIRYSTFALKKRKRFLDRNKDKSLKRELRKKISLNCRVGYIINITNDKKINALFVYRKNDYNPPDSKKIYKACNVKRKN